MTPSTPDNGATEMDVRRREAELESIKQFLDGLALESQELEYLRHGTEQ